MLISLILTYIEKPGTKIKTINAHLNFDLKWVNVTLLLHFFENHPNTAGNTVTIGFHVYDQLIFQIHCSINVHNNGFVPGRLTGCTCRIIKPLNNV